MFVSAGLDLQLHSTTEEGLESHIIHHPPSQARVISVSFCNDNTYVAFLCENEKPQILSAKDPTNVRAIQTIKVSNISSIIFKHNTKKTIAMGTKTGDVLIYDTKKSQVSNTMSKISEKVMALDFTCNDQQLCGLDGNTFFVFPDINSSSNVNKYKLISEGESLKCHPFIANRAAIGCKNGRVSLWDVRNGVELFHLDVFPDCPVSGVTMSSCGNFIVASGNDVKICGIDFDNANSNFNYTLEQKTSVTSVDLSADDKYLAVGLADGTLKLYDINQQLKPVFCAKLHDSPVNVIAFENKARELNSNFSTMSIKLSEQQIDKGKRQQNLNLSHLKSTKDADVRNESLQWLMTNLLETAKTEMDVLKHSIGHQCAKFNKYLNNEFRDIDTKITQSWGSLKYQ